MLRVRWTAIELY